MKHTCPERSRRIDPHVHCRDGKEAYKTTIREVSELAKEQDIVAILDMPNTDPPILREKDVIKRLKLARKRKPVVRYSLYVGLTSDEDQIREAVEIVRKYPEVVGLKLYCAKSGALGVPCETDQAKVYRILAELNYRGVLAEHCEKESKFNPELWDPRKPWTHSLAQPLEAEIESIEDQIRLAREENFQGILYICHVSCPESAKIIWQAKKYLNIFSEVTPHHLLMSLEEMRKKYGLLLKVNPPLREKERVRELLQVLKMGMIDCLGTDYAYHHQEAKLNPPYASGIACYSLYGQALTFLRQQGVSEKEIENLTYWNIKKAFGEKLKEV